MAPSIASESPSDSPERPISARDVFSVGSPPLALEIRGLRRRFGDVTAVDGLSLEVAVGEVFGLLGPNGAGKTTTINMACGLLRPDAGEILVRGESLARVQAEHRRWLGLCPQSIVLWERLTCLEQLELLGRLHGITVQVVRGRALELLERLGLSDKARCQARTLSGGMQRRLNLAMALIHDPAMVVLDEPEAGLDPQSRVLVREYVRSLAHDKTILLTTHNMDEAERMADRIAVIDQGRLLTIGTPKELLVRYGKDGQPAPDLEYVFLALTGRRLRE